MTDAGKHPRQSGFTIIELLIATMVFSVILLVITAGIVSFSKQYYKGVISSTTQGVARTIVDDVARAIQYNGGTVSNLTTNNPATPANPTSPVVGYCIGGAKRYSFSLNRQVVDTTPNPALKQSRHAVVSDTITGCNTSTVALNPASLPSNLKDVSIKPALNNPRELLGRNMRVSKFGIASASSNIYTITIRVIYGDDDLLCSPRLNDCNNSTMSTGLLNNDLTCKASAASEFCAVSELSTTVKKRVE